MNIMRAIYILGVKLATRLKLYERRQREYLRIVFKMLSILTTHKGKIQVALELDCGSGWLIRRIAKFCGLAMGIDIKSPNGWARGKDLNLEFIVTDARALPLRSNTVDFVIAISLLEHVSGWDRVVSEAWRVLRRGGLFVIQLPNLMYLIEPHTKFPLLGLLPKKLRAMLASSVDYGDLQFDCTFKNMLKVLKRYGFKYWSSSYYHMPCNPIRLPPTFFIIAFKG